MRLPLSVALSVFLVLFVIALRADAKGGAGSTPITTLELVAHLKLDGHVEGGFFRRTYASDYTLLTPAGDRRLSMSSIFYLLGAESPVGHFHLNKSDIVHYFHLGDPITYHLLHPNGDYQRVVMGPDLRQGQRLQLTVPGGVWKASEIPADGEHGFGLISEAVSPGFEYADMALGYRDQMLARFPQHRDLVWRLGHELPAVRDR